ncbi:mannonate dehydratase [Membranicola marinus]|uniref:Mannonate dehydratase n=1 Tax=Membranihabitans marinus TaxID=1227546 RepID=A0A953LBS7_9BACT|nr:mannonate dehydratase [Membranihabitans marinus]
MRWYGPDDAVSLADIRQSGATGVVTALHHIPNGDVWSMEEIEKRKSEVNEAGLDWHVVESLPVTEAMKLNLPEAKTHIENYKKSIRNLAIAGVKVITYNFMPVLDWTRTRLYHELEDGSLALYFSIVDLAAFDLYILQREGAANDYTPQIIEEARKLFGEMTDKAKKILARNILAGLPGSEAGYDLATFRDRLAMYDTVSADQLRRNLITFLEEVVPVAEENGVSLAIHPDDPPFQIFGIPRIVSTEADYDAFISAVPSIANGLCFCSGSLGARRDNDLTHMMTKYRDRIHFLHLRSVELVDDYHFYEADHLEGNADMVSLVNVFSNDNRFVYMRPDHGHAMMCDLANRNTNPGYTAVGRMKGLRAIMGIEKAILQLNQKS